eukprot:GFUD01087279.1.p1 GENE.GFUD01087279.1~~GFUD01087279.1.p1  ORF type:complete len:286 (-),score=37.20 GFUD01087279.1:79-936(-)
MKAKFLLALLVFLYNQDQHQVYGSNCGSQRRDTCRGDCCWADGLCQQACGPGCSGCGNNCGCFRLEVSSSCNRNPRTGECESSGCFPGSSVLTLRSGIRKNMTEIQIDDEVLVHGLGIFQPILGFLDLNHGKETDFIHIKTNMSTAISLTPSHIIFTQSTEEGKMIKKYAGKVMLGDVIFNAEQGKNAEVIKISKFSSVGYYAPLTKSGTLVVDGYLASCYASYPHWVAHTALYPARTWPGIFLGDTQEGTGTYLTMLKTLGNMVNLRNMAVPALIVMDAVKEEF